MVVQIRPGKLTNMRSRVLDTARVMRDQLVDLICKRMVPVGD